MTAELSLTLERDLAELQRMATEIEGFAEREDLPAPVVFKLSLALEELVSNVINHAGAGSVDPAIRLDLSLAEGAVTARISDSGPAFDPFNDAPRPDTALGVEEREIGGLGVHLVKSMIESADYAREEGRNVVTLRQSF